MARILTYEEVYTTYTERGCKLLVKREDYINTKSPLEYLCNCGNINKGEYHDFIRTKGCRTCESIKRSKSNKTPYETICNEFKKLNCTLLTPECDYIGVRTTADYICECGNKNKIIINNFLRGSRCRSCGYKKNEGEGNPVWQKDRTRRKRSNTLQFNKKNINILYDDPNYNDILKTPEKYHIDHVFPRIAFIDNNLDTIYDHALIRKICNSRDNLKIIPRLENESKAGKYIQEDFIKWFNLKILKENNFVFD